MASTFSVFVEGATAPGDRALAQLAHAMAERYGLPEADLLARMKKGRFRVKANIDRATADTYITDLAAIGARAIVEEGGRPTPPAGVPTTTPPPIAVGRTATNPQFQSGLSAAFAPSDAKMDLGALASDTPFKLSSIDGRAESHSDVGGEEARFTPPLAPAASSARATPTAPSDAAFEPPAARIKQTPKATPRPVDVPVDMFAPPDEGAELEVDIAPDDVDFRRSKPSIPIANVAVATVEDSPAPAASTPALRRSNPSLAPANVAAPVGVASTPGPLANPRTRLLVGVVLAILVGFIPAHFLASVREKSADKTIDERVVATQRSLPPDQLDTYRAGELDAKRGAHRNIALVSLLVWAAVGGGVGFAWHRRFRDA